MGGEGALGLGAGREGGEGDFGVRASVVLGICTRLREEGKAVFFVKLKAAMLRALIARIPPPHPPRSHLPIY